MRREDDHRNQDDKTGTRSAKSEQDDPRDAQREKPSRQAARAPDQPADEKEETKGRAEDEAGTSPKSKPGLLRRHPIWIGFAAIALIALGIGGYFAYMAYVYPFERTDDAFVDARQFTIAPKISGYLVEVPITDNQHVETGQTLFQIYKLDFEIALRNADAGVEAGEAAIKNIDTQVEAQNAQIDVAKAQVDTAQAALRFAQEDAARYKDLAERGAGTIQRSQQSNSDLQQRQASVTSANASVVAAQKQIGALQAQKASAIAQLVQARAQRDQAKLNLDYATVTAAQPGRIVELTGAKGQYAQAGQSLSMFVPDDIWVTANYKETQITDMRPGQQVDIAIDAYPNRTITGRIASVQPGSGTAFSLLPAQNATGNYVKVTQRVPVKIVVDNWPTDVSIGPGMSVVPKAHVR